MCNVFSQYDKLTEYKEQDLDLKTNKTRINKCFNLVV